MDYGALATRDTITKTADALKANGFIPHIIASKEEALKTIKDLIPQGASVMNGSSRTLEQIGFVELLKSGTHGWNNLHEGILAEKDKAKQGELRKQAAFAEYYLGSVHALTQGGELMISSASGSQLPHLVFTTQNIILVVGAQKIVSDLPDALTRIKEYVISREDAHMKEVGMGGTTWAKTLILNSEPAFMGRKVHVLLVNEQLGF